MDNMMNMDNEIIEIANSLLSQMAASTSARSDHKLLHELYLSLAVSRYLSRKRREELGLLDDEEDSHIVIEHSSAEVCIMIMHMLF